MGGSDTTDITSLREWLPRWMPYTAAGPAAWKAIKANSLPLSLKHCSLQTAQRYPAILLRSWMGLTNLDAYLGSVRKPVAAFNSFYNLKRNLERISRYCGSQRPVWSVGGGGRYTRAASFKDALLAAN